MRRAALAALMLAAGAARADECEAFAAQLVAQGATIDLKTRDGFDATLRGEKVELLCGDLASVTLETPSRLPALDFFTTAARAGTAVIAQDWPTLRDTAVECQKAALRDRTGYTRLDFDRGAMFCEVSKASLRITIQPLRRD